MKKWMGRRLLHLLLVCLLLPLPIVMYEWLGNPLQVTELQAVRGKLELTAQPWSNQQLYALNGQWIGQSGRSSAGPSAGPSAGSALVQYRNMPDRWVSGNHGFYIYELQLSLPKSDAGWGIAIGNVLTASRILLDGRELGRGGNPAVQMDEIVARNKPYYVYFPSSASGSRHTLVLEVANGSVHKGGVMQPLLIGTQQAIQTWQMSERSKDYVVTAVAAFFLLFFLVMYVQRRHDRTYLYFALMAGALTLHSLIFSQRLIYEWLPFISFDVVGKLQMLNTLSLIFFIKFYKEILDDRWLCRLSPWTDKFALLMLPVLFFLPYSFLTRFAEFFAVLIVCGFTLLLLVALRSLLRGSFRAFLIFLGFILPVFVSLKFAAYLLFDNLQFAEVNAVNPLIIPLFVLTQAIVIAHKQRVDEEQIRRTSTELVALDRKKQQFLLRTAHDLNNPLQAIVNMAHALGASYFDDEEDEARKDLLIIEQTSRRLALLVRDILDLEMMKSGSYALQRTTVDLYAAVASVGLLVRSYRQQQIINLQLQFLPDEQFVEMDEDRLQQILFNVMEYVQARLAQGTIYVDATTGASDMVELCVRGSGNLSAESSDELGLAISRDFMELHGGQLTVDISGEGGVVVCLLCPAAASPIAPESGTSEPVAGESFATPYVSSAPVTSASVDSMTTEHLLDATTPFGEPAGTVLLVYDFAPGLQVLRKLLEQEGYRIFTRTSADGIERMLACINEYAVDLCILDTSLATSSNIELCKQIRVRYHRAMLPILLMVGNRLEGLREAAFAAGANDIVEKPYHSLDMRGRVRSLVHMKQTALRLTQSEIAFLRAQIKPHFLYNALNTLMWASDKSPDETKYLIFHLSNVLRASYHFDGTADAVAFADELNVVRSYLAIEKARFANRLDVHYELETEQFKLPPFVLQPLVENALQHGILVNPAGGVLKIGTRRVLRGAEGVEGLEGVEVYTEDNGPGMTQALFQKRISADLLGHAAGADGALIGVGLPNVHMRLMRANNYGLRLEHVEPHGARVLFFIPMTSGGDET